MKGFGVDAQGRPGAMGHARVTTSGFAFFGYAFAPSSDHGATSDSVQFGFNRLAEEAGARGAARITGLDTEKTRFPILPFILCFFRTSVEGTLEP